jgi:hypothetical protein
MRHATHDTAKRRSGGEYTNVYRDTRVMSYCGAIA